MTSSFSYNILVHKTEIRKAYSPVKNNNLTELVRDVSFVFYGYKFVKSNNEIILEKSASVSNILDIKNEYSYIKKENMLHIIYSESYYSDKILINKNKIKNIYKNY